MQHFLRTMPALLSGLFLISLLSQPLVARELQLEEDQLIKVEVATLLLTQGGQPVVLLREPGHQQMIPIFIGPQEARAISDALQDTLPHRPMTHDLVNQVFRNLNAQLKRILIDDLQNGAYMGFLEVHLPDQQQPLLIDSRPSDALALALRAGAGIYVGPNVMASAALLDHESMDSQLVKAAGISVSEATEDLRQALDLPESPGVLVTATQDEAKAKGLTPGSLITGINGQAPRTPMEFLELIRQTPTQQTAEIAYWQDNQAHQLELEVDFSTVRPQHPTIQIPSEL